MKAGLARWVIGWSCLFGLTPSWAVNSFFELNDDELHCGAEPELNLYEGIVSALAQSDDGFSDLSFRKKTEEFKLEIVMHFDQGSTEIPEDCKSRLLNLSENAKNKKIGDILIRSSTGTEGSTEMDLAIASERLNQIKQFFRSDRLARRALILELHPLPSSTVLEKAIKAPQIVEVYSSPLN